MAKHLLVVAHSQSGGTLQLARAAVRGAQAFEPNVTTTLLAAHAVQPHTVSICNGLIIATPENFGYMSGLIKDFFDRCFYPCEAAMPGKPYALMVCAGNDGTGAMNAMERIIAGWRMQRVHAGLIARRVGGQAGSAQGELADVDLSQAHEIGATLAAGLEVGIY
jgi:NADPH-dependent FMN reductase